jgi:putative membrane protein
MAADQQMLAYERTRIASERTLMAWVRTAVSLISFGFSIPKFFDALQRASSLQGEYDPTPHTIGALLIGLGVMGLAGGILEHLRLLRRIALAPGQLPPQRSAVLVIAALVWITGAGVLTSLLMARD